MASAFIIARCSGLATGNRRPGTISFTETPCVNGEPANQRVPDLLSIEIPAKRRKYALELHRWRLARRLQTRCGGGGASAP